MFDPRAAIAELIARRCVELPPYPAIAMRLNRMLEGDDYTLTQIAEVVALDAALTARVLRLANASAFAGGPTGEPLSLPTALARMGARRISRVALAAALGADACAEGPLVSLKYLAWRQSLLCAFLAQRLASGSVDAEEAFLCGLLQGLGRTITLAYLEQAALDHSFFTLLPAETWLLVVSSYERRIGVEVANAWQLPETICQVIGEAPGNSLEAERLLETVRSARALVDLMERQPSVDDRALEPLIADAKTRDALLRFIPTLPALVDSLNDPDQRLTMTPRSSLVAGDAELLPAPLFPVDFDVVLVSGKREFHYRAQRLGPAGCLAAGTQTIPENWFARMRLNATSEAFELWCRVTRCEQTHNGVMIAFQPYALTSEPQTRWQGLVQSVSAHAA